MCRHVAALGRPRDLGRLLRDAPHALVRQADAARLAAAGPENRDGWGVAWWDPARTRWHRYRSAAAMPDDPARPDAGVQATVTVAAVRRASPGAPRGADHVAPFLVAVPGVPGGALACSLNGHVPHLVGSRTDAAVLAATLAAETTAGTPLDAALAAVTLRHAAPRRGCNLLAATPTTLVGGAWVNSLFVRADPDGVVVASEPLDDGAWTRVPDRHLVVARVGRPRSATGGGHTAAGAAAWDLVPMRAAAA